MPFALIIIGTVLLVAAVRNTIGGPDGLFTLLKNDFTGSNNFTYWVVSLLIIGAIGYIPTMRPLSRWFLALVIVVLFISQGGFFSKFNLQAFGQGSSSAAAAAGQVGTSQPISVPVSLMGSLQT